MKKAITSKYGKSVTVVERAAEQATANAEAEAVTIYAAEIAEAAAARRQTAGDPLAKYRDMTYLEFDEPAPTYQRTELEAYIGAEHLGDYDLEAIEHEATAYDPATSRTVWTAGPEELASICQRHELVTA